MYNNFYIIVHPYINQCIKVTLLVHDLNTQQGGVKREKLLHTPYNNK